MYAAQNPPQAAQATPEYCLMYPEPIPPRATLEIPVAVDFLRRGLELAQKTAFQWTYIDKPQDGQLFFVFLTPQTPGIPADGIRYLDQDTRYPVPTGTDVELDLIETKSGYVPGVDHIPNRLRRAYRLTRGGHPSCLLVHYSRMQAPTQSIPVQYLNLPVRRYPLQPVNMPPVVPIQTPRADPAAAAAIARQQTAALSAQTAALDQREQQRNALAKRQVLLPEPDYDDHDDGAAHVTARALALARYKRNHELMTQVFNNAARLLEPPPPAPPVPGMAQDELAAAAAKLEEEVAALEAKRATSKRARVEPATHDTDVSMAVEVA